MENLDLSRVSKLWLYLSGKKTYLIAAGSILIAVGNALGDGNWSAAWRTIEPALLAMGIRHSIS